MSNDELYDKALEAISVMFEDQSVSQDETRSNLQSLQDEIEIMMDSLYYEGE